MLRASACKPDMAHPMCLSISTIFSTEDVSSKVEVTRFSTPRMTPEEVETFAIHVQYIRLLRDTDCGRRTYAYCCGTELDGFEGVFDLEETAFRREGAGDSALAQ